MLHQQKYFGEIFQREIPDTPSYDLIKILIRITRVTFICLTIFYEFKLLMRIATSILYTHDFIRYVSPEKQVVFNWVFYS